MAVTIRIGLSGILLLGAWRVREVYEFPSEL